MKIIKNLFSLKSYSLTFWEMYLFAPLAKLDEYQSEFSLFNIKYETVIGIKAHLLRG